MEALEEIFCYDKDEHDGLMLKQFVKKIRGGDRYTHIVWDVRSEEIYTYKVNLEEKKRERLSEMVQLLDQLKRGAPR